MPVSFWGFCRWLILGQKLNAKEMLGCCLIFAAIILAQLPVQRKAKLADEVMGRTGVSKKLKYFWKKILILTWMFSLFLGILADNPSMQDVTSW